ncbi:ABC transporter permease [Ammoniphilus resinae]|uniref:ABC-type multidrug transport system permease subunit n=1 Tax=Ammoniphilus resinae TaxID=861532 RepID=A0ABS4GQ02_9BACL|nr:ABC transporter permease [Ammoniphilus resinae]MBP1932202.1 ABC-type multidrug transport system permease subunit [Ammoniphilus resinae]
MIFDVIRLHFQLLRKDLGFFVLMLAFPVIITAILGFSSGFEKQSVIRVALTDLDHTDYSRLIVDRFLQRKGIDVQVVKAEQARELVGGYRVEAAFIINEGFMDQVLEGDVDDSIVLLKNPGSLSHGIVGEMLASEVMRIYANTLAANQVEEMYQIFHWKTVDGDSLRETAWGYADSLWEPEPLVQLEYREHGKELVSRQEPPSFTLMISLGMLLLSLMLFIMFQCGWVLEEKSRGTWKRVLAAPGLLRSYTVGYMLYLFLLSGLQVVIYAVLAKQLFGVVIFATVAYFVVIAAYIFAVIGLGMLASTWFRTREQFQSGIPVIALLFAFLGGCFWSFSPSEMAEKISLFTPQGWALVAIKDLMLSGAVGHTLPVAVLILIGIASMVWSFIRLRQWV